MVSGREAHKLILTDSVCWQNILASDYKYRATNTFDMSMDTVMQCNRYPTAM